MDGQSKIANYLKQAFVVGSVASKIWQIHFNEVFTQSRFVISAGVVGIDVHIFMRALVQAGHVFKICCKALRT